MEERVAFWDISGGFCVISYFVDEPQNLLFSPDLCGTLKLKPQVSYLSGALRANLTIVLHDLFAILRQPSLFKKKKFKGSHNVNILVNF